MSIIEDSAATRLLFDQVKFAKTRRRFFSRVLLQLEQLRQKPSALSEEAV